MSSPKLSFDIPRHEPILEKSGLLARAWDWFFTAIFDRLYPLGVERSFPILNNRVSPTPVDGVRFNSRGVGFVVFEYVVRRHTSSSKVTESGIILFTYRPEISEWHQRTLFENQPANSGVSFLIDSTGQIYYTSSNQSGTPEFAGAYYRARTMGTKHPSFSAMGAR